ncbi:MAG TPA: nuclear transport factor 2 family protein [Chryseolinea sp.]
MRRVISCVLFFSMAYLVLSCNKEKPLHASALTALDSVEQAMFDATSNGDSMAFRKLCGTDYFTINANGEGHTLEETIPYVPRFKGSTSKLSEQRQRVYGNFVLRNGRLKAYMNGQQVAEALYSIGWLYRDDRWQFVHWQGTLTGMMLAPLADKVNLEPPPLK